MTRAALFHTADPADLLFSFDIVSTDEFNGSMFARYFDKIICNALLDLHNNARWVNIDFHSSVSTFSIS